MTRDGNRGTRWPHPKTSTSRWTAMRTEIPTGLPSQWSRMSSGKGYGSALGAPKSGTADPALSSTSARSEWLTDTIDEAPRLHGVQAATSDELLPALWASRRFPSQECWAGPEVRLITQLDATAASLRPSRLRSTGTEHCTAAFPANFLPRSRRLHRRQAPMLGQAIVRCSIRPLLGGVPRKSFPS